jgi:hypothetical protein
MAQRARHLAEVPVRSRETWAKAFGPRPGQPVIPRKTLEHPWATGVTHTSLASAPSRRSCLRELFASRHPSGLTPNG